MWENRSKERTLISQPLAWEKLEATCRGYFVGDETRGRSDGQEADRSVRIIYGGFEHVVTTERLREVAIGLSHFAEVRDHDGRPVVVRVSRDHRGLRVEAWGV